ncbi:hypothetical protein WAK64_09275 [Bacillus spongiae]|uniref:YhfM-like domain-containing protein n=1 Tax=Bacillus spongiae TaxID=2683610 RepID=A0ABU8HD76_9BACI
MIKRVVIITVIALFCFIGFTMFYNGFSGVQSVMIQEYNHSFEEGKKVTDQEIIGTVTGILNRANKITNTQYKLAIEPNYRIQLEYKNEEKEVLLLYEGFDQNESLISTDRSNNYYKLNKKQTKSMVQLLFNE